MKFGVSVATNIANTDLAVEAERLGYDSFWGTDSHMLWSDVYSYLALAAVKTSRINLGTAIAVAPTRIAPVTAQSIATVHRLAPGRVRLGLGTAHTAMRTMGMKPMGAAAFADYVRVVAGLLHGEEVEYEMDGSRHPIRFMQPQFDGIRLDPPIPLFIGAAGPRAQRLAGQYGDGLMASRLIGSMKTARLNVAEGMKSRVGPMPEDFAYVDLCSVAVVEPGESPLSDRLLNIVGPQVLSMYHAAWDSYVLDPAGFVPPAPLANQWESYLRRVQSRFAEQGIDVGSEYLSIHDLHGTYVADDEREFVTEDLVRAVAIVGERDEVAERLAGIKAAGVSELILRLGYEGAAEAMASLAPLLAALR